MFLIIQKYPLIAKLIMHMTKKNQKNYQKEKKSFTNESI